MAFEIHTYAACLRKDKGCLGLEVEMYMKSFVVIWGLGVYGTCSVNLEAVLSIGFSSDVMKGLEWQDIYLE